MQDTHVHHSMVNVLGKIAVSNGHILVQNVLFCLIPVSELEENNVSIFSTFLFILGCLSGLCFGVSLLLSPLVMTFCRKKSTRLTAVVGGLVLSLGILYTSFANQFYQLFFSYGTVIGNFSRFS